MLAKDHSSIHSGFSPESSLLCDGNRLTQSHLLQCPWYAEIAKPAYGIYNVFLFCALQFSPFHGDKV